MSQSDYIKFKKTQNKITLLNKFPSVLNAGDYTDFKQYGIETNIIGNTYIKPQLNQLIPIGKTCIFDMEINTTCPKMSIVDPSNSFITCQSTNRRINRILN
jgi:hypothetical protein